MSKNMLSDLLLFFSGRDAEIASENKRGRVIEATSSNRHWSPFSDFKVEEYNHCDAPDDDQSHAEEEVKEREEPIATGRNLYSWARPKRESGFLVPSDILDEDD
jgi:hypothetical protein